MASIIVATEHADRPKASRHSLGSAFCSFADDSNDTQGASASASPRDGSLLAELWRLRPNSSNLPIRLARHIPAELKRAARNPITPRSSLLRLLLQGLSEPVSVGLSGVPSDCVPLTQGPVHMRAPQPSGNNTSSGDTDSTAHGCSLSILTAFATSKYLAALTQTPVRSLLHNATALVDSILEPDDCSY